METKNASFNETMSMLEGILFAAGDPVDLSRICAALGLPKETARQALKQLSDAYEYGRRGIRIVQMQDQYQMVSSPEYGDAIRGVFEMRKPARLSQPALEVLTIVAYYQPVTRAYIDQIRGVDSAYTVGLLLNRRMIEECGRLQVVGRPRLYRTTDEFLRAFHLKSLDELPELPGDQLQVPLPGDDAIPTEFGETAAERDGQNEEAL